MHGEETRRAIAAQPEWLAQVPTDRRFPDGARLLFTGCGTSFHAAMTGGEAVQALELVSRMEEVSVSKLQREMRLGYNKAAKIVERMEREGIVGPPNGVKPRQVLIRPIGETSPYPNV